MALRVKALESLLVEKGLVDAAALDAIVDHFEHKVGPRNGARVVARAWTDPAQLKQWFVPRPWTISACTIELAPGGAFQFTMRSPEGEESHNDCCILEVVPNRRLVWTAALSPGFRPSKPVHDVPHFTAVVTLEPLEKGTQYRVVAMHQDGAGAERHAAMGFHEGWGQCLAQMIELVERPE